MFASFVTFSKEKREIKKVFLRRRLCNHLSLFLSSKLFLACWI
ncbi:hypothetical protein ABH13_1091 [Bacillus velezensis]|nr:hypothetical protein U471_10960 [Bacillus amyloliquefaciens CC178]AKL75693.1 hypothetical protein ABH13_1091 [Bacillus velezensis]EIF12637.1 hypothetical protein MY7_0960 [Bacillus sp. 5B6]KYC88013.1 hypothetical protein B4140_1184 [Bacillus amyloliquefaciens]GFR54119.1 hypothetical protein MY7_0960 [Bacillus sp. CN2]